MKAANVLYVVRNHGRRTIRASGRSVKAADLLYVVGPNSLTSRPSEFSKMFARLRDSKTLMARARSIEFFDLSKNSLEQTAAKNIERVLNQEILSGCADVQQRRFLFRCYWVPKFCMEILKLAGDRVNEGAPLWLWEHATYLLAYERMTWEMLLQSSPQETPNRGRKPQPPTSGVSALKLPPPASVDWFESLTAGFDFWTMRFDAWREAAVRSFRFYQGHYCPESTNPENANAQAALAGYIQGRTPLPTREARRVQNQLAEIGADLAFYFRNVLAPKPTQFGLDNLFECTADTPASTSSLALDTWLIEIWPLVESEGWLYPDLVDLIALKSGKWKALVGDDEQCRTRCKKLRLPLTRKGGPREGARRRGLQPTSVVNLATAIRGFGEQPVQWFKGQRGVVLS